ncbi:MAG: Re/Si-specific NAD(P)(+) transhydrogenase subunit alpha [Bdellovibrionota bacterium]
MKIGIPKEIRTGETRVSASPETVKKLLKKGYQVLLERGAGVSAGFADEDYEGVEFGDAKTALGQEIVFKIHKPSSAEILSMKKGAILFAMLEPYAQDGTFEKLAEMGVSAFAMESVPRTSRAQSMDVLSSQANIAGYRAVIEAAARYGRFLPLMMTSAGSAKPAKLTVLGAGVAGLQAIATARRLGANVEAYDVRAEVREQIESLGAKFIDLDIGEEGSGSGGYAKELSEEAKQKQQKLLTERLMKSDILITTANIPGRKSPVLVTEEAVRGMRTGSVIVDMAAANGGNCPLTEADRVVVKHGVTLVGHTNYPGMMPADASSFYGSNLISLLGLLPDGKLDLNDDIIAAALVTHQGEVRWKKKG